MRGNEESVWERGQERHKMGEGEWFNGNGSRGDMGTEIRRECRGDDYRVTQLHQVKNNEGQEWEMLAPQHHPGHPHHVSQGLCSLLDTRQTSCKNSSSPPHSSLHEATNSLRRRRTEGTAPPLLHPRHLYYCATLLS